MHHRTRNAGHKRPLTIGNNKLRRNQVGALATSFFCFLLSLNLFWWASFVVVGILYFIWFICVDETWRNWSSFREDQQRASKLLFFAQTTAVEVLRLKVVPHPTHSRRITTAWRTAYMESRSGSSSSSTSSPLRDKTPRAYGVTPVGVRIPPSAPHSLRRFVFSKMARALKQKPPYSHHFDRT